MAVYENSLFPGRRRLKYWGGKCRDVCSLPMDPLSGLAHKQCIDIEKATWRWTSKRLAAEKPMWWVHSVHYSYQNIIGFFFSFSEDFYFLRKTIIYIFYKKETKLLLGAFHDLHEPCLQKEEFPGHHINVLWGRSTLPKIPQSNISHDALLRMNYLSFLQKPPTSIKCMCSSVHLLHPCQASNLSQIQGHCTTKPY